MRILGRAEGALLLGLATCAGGFAAFGNYAFLMNPRFAGLTLTGAGLVGAMGLASLFAPRRRPSFSGLAALLAMGLVVAVGQPHVRDVNALTLPDLPDADAAPNVLDGVRYEPTVVNDLHNAVDRGEDDLEGRPLLITGLLKRSPGLDAAGHFALMRPVSICCAADALLVGFQAIGEAPVALTDEWVHVYGRLQRTESPLPLPALRHGAIRFAVVSETHILEAVRVVPYVRPRPKEGVFARLPANRFGVFVSLVEAADPAALVAGHDTVTVLAPVDAAFDAIPASRLEGWIAGRDRAGLRSFLAKHILAGELTRDDLGRRTSAQTIDGRAIRIRLQNGTLHLGSARVLFADIQARNGLVHAIYPTAWSIDDAD